MQAADFLGNNYNLLERMKGVGKKNRRMLRICTMLRVAYRLESLKSSLIAGDVRRNLRKCAAGREKSSFVRYPERVITEPETTPEIPDSLCYWSIDPKSPTFSFSAAD